MQEAEPDVPDSVSVSCQTEVDFVSKEEHDKLQENFESLKKEFEKLRREHNDMLVKSAEERAKENEVQLNIFFMLGSTDT